MYKSLVVILLFMVGFRSWSGVVSPEIGQVVHSDHSSLSLKMVGRIQGFNPSSQGGDQYDPEIYSPKSVMFHPSLNKFYVNSLEGTNTKVFGFHGETGEVIPLKTLFHRFNSNHTQLFQSQKTLFNYKFNSGSAPGTENHFRGKPVEMTFSHGGRYLWVTYYRRSFDPFALDPSAVAIIDTHSDEIVRVMPTGPLPKMIVATPSSRYLAVTHWGDNTVGLIDTSSEDPLDFRYVRHLMRDRPLKIVNNGQSRDKNCGRCLRGTVFLEEEGLLLVGEMRGGQLIAFNYKTGEFLGSLSGVPSTVRHIVLSDDGERVYFSSNALGQVSYVDRADLVRRFQNLKGGHGTFKMSVSQKIGKGARTIVLDPKDDILWATAFGDSRLVGLDALTLQPLLSIDTNSYPVGLGISPSGRFLISTSQGKKGRGGNSVNIFQVFKGNEGERAEATGVALP